jgi:hypothetical protein
VVERGAVTGSQNTIVTVASTSPLMIRETAASEQLPAKVVTGSSYTPAVGDQVVATFIRTRWYILGGCA